MIKFTPSRNLKFALVAPLISIFTACGGGGGGDSSAAASTTRVPIISAFAGTGVTGFSGDGGVATAAQMSSPWGGATDSVGNYFFYDFTNCRVRVVAHATSTIFGVAATAGNIYTVAGNGSCGYTGDGGLALSAQIDSGGGIAIDGNDHLYVTSTVNVIRMIAAAPTTFAGQVMNSNKIYTIAGTGVTGFSGDGAAATAAKLSTPRGMTFDAADNLYFIDSGNFRVRMLSRRTETKFGQAVVDGNIYTLAGVGTQAYSGDTGSALAAQLNNPEELAINNIGDIFLSDSNNIRVVVSTNNTLFGVNVVANNIYSIAGNGFNNTFNGDGLQATATNLNNPSSLKFDTNGNLFFAETTGNRIRVVTKTAGTAYAQTVAANSVYTVVGTGSPGGSGDGGAATAANINSPKALAFDTAGALYFGDSGNNRIRKVTP